MFDQLGYDFFDSVDRNCKTDSSAGAARARCNGGPSRRCSGPVRRSRSRWCSGASSRASACSCRSPPGRACGRRCPRRLILRPLRSRPKWSTATAGGTRRASSGQAIARRELIRRTRRCLSGTPRRPGWAPGRAARGAPVPRRDTGGRGRRRRRRQLRRLRRHPRRRHDRAVVAAVLPDQAAALPRVLRRTPVRPDRHRERRGRDQQAAAARIVAHLADPARDGRVDPLRDIHHGVHDNRVHLVP